MPPTKSLLTGFTSALILMIIGGSAAQNGASAADGSGQFQATVSRPVVLTIVGMDRVKVRHDIIYKQDGATSLTMDVYTPPDLTAGSTRPAVIFIHGGLPG